MCHKAWEILSAWARLSALGVPFHFDQISPNLAPFLPSTRLTFQRLWPIHLSSFIAGNEAAGNGCLCIGLIRCRWPGRVFDRPALWNSVQRWTVAARVCAG